MRAGHSTAISIALVLNIFLSVYQVNGQDLIISPEWKNHFTNTPVIQDCVFERVLLSEEFHTNLYQFKSQKNAFMLREIGNTNDADVDIIRVRLNYAGRFENNCWAIDWAPDGFGTLKLYPNTTNIWSIMPGNGDFFLAYVAERFFFSALYYGIPNLNPATVTWTEESKFTAKTVDGQEISGEVTEAVNGLPTVLVFRHPDAKDQTFRFILEYKYDSGLDLAYYPTEFRLFVKSGNKKKTLVDIYKILGLKTASKPLDESYFDPNRYFDKTSAPKNRASILVYSNNSEYDVSGGLPQEVIGSSPAETLTHLRRVTAHPQLIRFAIFGFFVVSAIGLLLVVRHAKK